MKIKKNSESFGSEFKWGASLTNTYSNSESQKKITYNTKSDLISNEKGSSGTESLFWKNSLKKNSSSENDCSHKESSEGDSDSNQVIQYFDKNNPFINIDNKSKNIVISEKFIQSTPQVPPIISNEEDNSEGVNLKNYSRVIRRESLPNQFPLHSPSGEQLLRNSET